MQFIVNSCRDLSYNRVSYLDDDLFSDKLTSLEFLWVKIQQIFISSLISHLKGQEEGGYSYFFIVILCSRIFVKIIPQSCGGRNVGRESLRSKETRQSILTSKKCTQNFLIISLDCVSLMLFPTPTHPLSLSLFPSLSPPLSLPPLSPSHSLFVTQPFFALWLPHYWFWIKIRLFFPKPPENYSTNTTRFLLTIFLTRRESTISWTLMWQNTSKL